MKRRVLALVLALPFLAACSEPETAYNSPKRAELSDVADSYLSCEWDHLQTLDEGETIGANELQEKCNYDELHESRQREIDDYRSEIRG